ncbi:o-succinylbenzoate synthase [Salinimicrobium sp. GXAS 041]|uniref:o-succinylbenzoate synthase n=1 Tax=Salinimicrobium sp. GXAS 041 TaxID=3400806 RepID=UPI003C71CA60
MKATYQKYILKFKRPSGTSRGVLTEKESWFILIEKDGKRGIGECGLLRGLSIDDRPDYEQQLKWTCENIHLGKEELWKRLSEFPSIQFGVEMAFQSLAAQDPFLLFPSEFTRGNDAIPINGLVWMGEKAFMKDQILQKIKDGFSCIKLKIGAIDFETELDLLKFIRSEFSSVEMEIRVDANGAFSPSEALEKLKRLSDFTLHSIEQPIKPGQYEEMAALCEKTPLPIALDEDLIGVTSVTKKAEMLQIIQPQYVIFKPSLIGGFNGTLEWRTLAEKKNIGWWVTSALESNVGLNAISQFTYTLENDMLQGLGTGGLYTNNFESPLKVEEGQLFYEPQVKWNFNI